VSADTDFAGFAAATVAAAGDHADVVREAWSTVGVDPSGSSPTPAPAPAPAVQLLRVRRTGGIAGRTVEGDVDLDDGSPRAAQARELLTRADLTSPPAVEQTIPDAFSYTFETDGRSVTVPQQSLTADQRALADLVLGGG
jgi:hypothetical protein